jgi:hypothetical protein
MVEGALRLASANDHQRKMGALSAISQIIISLAGFVSVSCIIVLGITVLKYISRLLLKLCFEMVQLISHSNN